MKTFIEPAKSNVIQVTNPLKVGNHYATSVAVRIGDNLDTSLLKNFIGFIGNRTIGSFSNKRRLNMVCILGIDNTFQCRWYKNIAGTL